MNERQETAVVSSEQDESRAGYGLVDSQSLSKTPDERSLPCAEFATDQDNVTVAYVARQLPPHGTSVGFAGGVESNRHRPNKSSCSVAATVSD